VAASFVPPGGLAASTGTALSRGRGTQSGGQGAGVAPSYYVQNFGCRAAQADGAALELALRSQGLGPSDSRAAAGLVVINTCTVTAAADQDARQAIRRAHRENPAARILVTGCYAQRAPHELAAIPGVTWVVGNSHKPYIAGLVQLAPAHLPFHGQIHVGDIGAQTEFLSSPVENSVHDRTRPNLKIQDGCHNRCSFCIIPAVRGPSRSMPAGQVVAQVGGLAARYREIVLSGINLGRWGRDLPDRPRLPALLRRLVSQTEVARLRLSSVEPLDWTDELLELLASEPRIARHVHAPLQSGSDPILRRMHRRYRARHYAGRILLARRLMPEAAIGADVMVGFPGETDADFEATRRLIAGLPFTYLHVFTYSARPSTAAAAWPGQVAAPVKRERNRILRDLAEEKGQAFRQSLVGRRLSVLTLDEPGCASTTALSDNYLKVVIEGEPIPPNRIVEVELLSAQGAARPLWSPFSAPSAASMPGLPEAAPR